MLDDFMVACLRGGIGRGLCSGTFGLFLALAADALLW